MFTEAFYLAIPTVDASPIQEKDALDKKVELVNMLGDIALTQKALKKQTKRAKSKNAALSVAEPHPLDEKYTSLGCGLSPVQKSDPVWKTINEYFRASVDATRLV